MIWVISWVSCLVVLHGLLINIEKPRRLLYNILGGGCTFTSGGKALRTFQSSWEASIPDLMNSNSHVHPQVWQQCSSTSPFSCVSNFKKKNNNIYIYIIIEPLLFVDMFSPFLWCFPTIPPTFTRWTWPAILVPSHSAPSRASFAGIAPGHHRSITQKRCEGPVGGVEGVPRGGRSRRSQNTSCLGIFIYIDPKD